MKAREKEVEAKINRYFAMRWILTELAAIMEPVSLRTLVSWFSGQTLRLRPLVWPARESEAPPKISKRAKYGFPNLLQCVTARTLFDAGVEREMVQQFAGGPFPAPFDAQNYFSAYALILTARSPQVGYFFADRQSLTRAIADNPAPFPQCSVFNFASIMDEAIGRLDAWEQRRPYIPKQENILADAEQARIDTSVRTLSEAIRRKGKNK